MQPAGNYGLPILKIKIDSQIRAATDTLQGLRRDSATAPVNTNTIDMVGFRTRSASRDSQIHLEANNAEQYGEPCQFWSLRKSIIAEYILMELLLDFNLQSRLAGRVHLPHFLAGFPRGSCCPERVPKRELTQKLKFDNSHRKQI